MNFKNDSFSIGFVVFYPNNSLLDRIFSAIELGYKIYIFDNSPSNTMIKEFCDGSTSCSYQTSGKNVGLGIGISSICKRAFNDKFTGLLFFDQDTIFSKATLNFIKQMTLSGNINFELFSAIQFSNKKKNLDGNGKELIERKLLISSGSLFNLKVLNRINWHNKSYFVDGVDYEFCLRSSINGYLLGEYPDTPEFDHVSGQEDELYEFLGLKLFLRAYSYQRIHDTLIAYYKLCLYSLNSKKIDYMIIFLRSFLIFSYYQFLVRIINLRKINGYKK